MSNLLFYFISFAIVVSVIVFVHEFGHYIFAKMFGIKVEEFSIGFGKELVGFNDRSGTRWKFSMIPAGGYVKMFEDADEIGSLDYEKIQHIQDDLKAQTLHFKPLHQKALVIFGGPLANFIFAFLLLSFLYSYLGKVNIEPIVTSIVVNSPAESAGFKVGDKILKMNGEKVTGFDKVKQFIYLNGEREISFVLLRDAQELSIRAKPRIELGKDLFGNQENVPKLGIESSVVSYSKVGLTKAMGLSVIEIGNTISSTIKVLSQIIIGRSSTDSIGGPIKIAKYSGQSFKMGYVTVIWFMAMLSINLGLFNLFPIPMLDGGHLLFYLIEWINGGKVAMKYQEWANRVGMAVLLAILVFAAFNDIRFILR